MSATIQYLPTDNRAEGLYLYQFTAPNPNLATNWSLFMSSLFNSTDLYDYLNTIEAITGISKTSPWTVEDLKDNSIILIRSYSQKDLTTFYASFDAYYNGLSLYPIGPSFLIA